jgi:endonuclease G
MIQDPFQIQRELRYGAPVCDTILTGRYFSIGYSWYFRQAKWTLEIVDPLLPLLPDAEDRERLDNFRADPRVPMRFRAGLDAYRKSGFDRGHLAASAHHDQLDIQNSETWAPPKTLALGRLRCFTPPDGGGACVRRDCSGCRPS